MGFRRPFQGRKIAKSWFKKTRVLSLVVPKKLTRLSPKDFLGVDNNQSTHLPASGESLGEVLLVTGVLEAESALRGRGEKRGRGEVSSPPEADATVWWVQGSN
jgi:hypothetical protein